MKCECGHEWFNVATNNRYARCSKCGKFYDEHGEEIQVSGLDTGMTIFFKDNKILAPKMREYKGQSLLHDDYEEM